MNREETLKKFNTYSSLFLVLGILDLVLIWLSFGNKDMIALLHGCGSAAASALRVLFLVTVVLGVILAVLKFYVGIQGLRQVKGNARGDLHLKVARGTMILSMISLVLSLLMILKGGGDASDALLDLGYLLSFSGIVTFANADPLRTVARTVPGERLLIETDTPYLTPVPLRGRPNEPAYVPHVAACLARARGTGLDELAGLTRANAERLFG